MEDSLPKSIKVLAIDGGGIRGIIPAILIAEIQKRLSAALHTIFDLIAGTSTGGIIALGIGTRCNNGEPYTPSDLAKLYVENGSAIFHKSLLTWPRKWFYPKYSPASLEAVLKRYFGDTKFCTALTPLLISSYDLQSQRPFFFKSSPLPGTNEDNDNKNHKWEVTTIARATSAAPTFFPPIQVLGAKKRYTLVDGGVFANNPAMAAYAEARRLYPNAKRFLVGSVGTGDRQDHITYASARRWGLAGWAWKIVPVFMDSVSEAIDYELSSLEGLRYFRLQPSDLLPASNDMDDASQANIENLQKVAARYVASNSELLDEFCLQLQDGSGKCTP